MTLVRYAMILVLGLTPFGTASAQEHPPLLTDPASSHTVASLKERAEFFEAKAQLATQCAKGLRLIQKVMTLTAPSDDEEEAQFFRETYLLLRMWFTKEQQDEWYFAEKESAADLETYLEGVSTKAEAMERYKRVFASIMNAQVAVLQKLSADLDGRMNRMEQARSSD